MGTIHIANEDVEVAAALAKAQGAEAPTVAELAGTHLDAGAKRVIYTDRHGMRHVFEEGMPPRRCGRLAPSLYTNRRG